ncbi:MAG: hypothetical protein IJZ20_04020, partial [Clostridia bacterium]|nr:hypothetical protein [Clostridia bacterium]
IKEFDIDADTAVACGEAVGLLDDKVVRADEADSILGVSAEEHTGIHDELNTRSDGTRIRVIISPDAVYAVKNAEYAAVSGTESSLTVSSDGLSVGVTSGYAMLVGKGENSVNTDRIGSKRRISACAVNGEVATLTLEAGSVASEGDIYVLIPEIGTKLYGDEEGTGVCFFRQASRSTYTFVCADADGKILYAKLNGSVFA